MGILLLVIGGLSELPLAPLAPPSLDLERGSRQIGWAAAEESAAIAFDIYERVNDERAARGLAPLVWHEGLGELARRWSEEMIATGYRHSTPEFRSHPEFAGTGENIYMGPRDAGEAHEGWMWSEGHRDNLLDPSYRAVGIGVVCRNDGHMWATQIFGVPVGAPFAPRVPTTLDPIVRTDEGTPCPRSGARRLW